MKRLLLIPLAGGIVVAFGMLIKDPAAYYRAVLIVAAFMTALSAFVTMRNFAVGEKLFAGWLLLGAGYTLAGVRYLMRLYELATAGDLYGRSLEDTMLILQNVLGTVAFLMFVWAWRSTGLASPLGRRAETLWNSAGVVVAIVVGGYPLLQGIATAQANSVLMVSTIGDMIGIALIVPLAMSALALRGGLLMHTWLYLAAGKSLWLAYDVWVAIEEPAGLTPGVDAGVEQILRILAILFVFAATIAQRRAMRPVRAFEQGRPAPAAI